MSNIGSRRKNPLNLSLPATVKENDVTKSNEEEELGGSNVRTFSLEEQIKQMTLTEPQKRRMQEFMQEKKQVNCF